MRTESRKLTLKNYIGYGTMDLFGGGAFAIIGAWMLYFFITYCGLTPVEAGSIIAIARIIDAIASPLMGHILIILVVPNLEKSLEGEDSFC